MVSDKEISALESAAAKATPVRLLPQRPRGAGDALRIISITESAGVELRANVFLTAEQAEYFTLAANLTPKLLERLRRAEEALRFYSNGDHYLLGTAACSKCSQPYWGGALADVMEDHGDKARAYFQSVAEGEKNA